MKKIVVPLLLMSIVPITGMAHNLNLKSLAAPSINHWVITLKTLTLNNKIPSKLKNIDLGMQFKLEYKFNQNVYVAASTTRFNKNKWGMGATVGIQDNPAFIQPYSELNYIKVPVNNRWLELIGYDVGTNINLTHGISPFVELDNFLQKNREAISGGVSFNVFKNISIGASYSKNIQNAANGFNVKTSYAF